MSKYRKKVEDCIGQYTPDIYPISPSVKAAFQKISYKFDIGDNYLIVKVKKSGTAEVEANYSRISNSSKCAIYFNTADFVRGCGDTCDINCFDGCSEKICPLLPIKDFFK